MMEMETRKLPTSTLELREATEEQSAKITGYAIVFNDFSDDLGGFVERIAPTALDKTDLGSVRLLYNHDYSNILSRADTGTLQLKRDDHGLAFTATLPDTTLGHDVLANIRNGNLQGCSFGFTINEDSWNYDNMLVERTVNEIDQLFELSITPIPAYADTSVSTRSVQLAQQLRATPDLQNELTLLKIESEELIHGN